MLNILRVKRQLNEIAELGWKEIKTTQFIKKTLKDMPLKEGFNSLKTGILYKLGKGSNSILLRADIDGLKTAQGIKHTCGHSTHMASLMGTFFYAKQRENELTIKNKSLYFLFQPAEETFPSGAHAFISECPDVIARLQSAYAIHVRPQMPIGTIGLQPGTLWARGDYMEIEVKGKMVHIKNNQNGVDAIYASTLIVKGIHSIQSKYPSVRIGIGVISGGRQANTVADNVILKGDIRILDSIWQSKIKKMLILLVQNVERKTKTQISLHYFDGTPPVINNVHTTALIMTYLKKRSDLPFKIQSSSRLFSYGCEDFAYIAEKVPSTIALIGTGDRYDLHEENCTISDKGTINAHLYFNSIIDWFLQRVLSNTR